MGFSSLTLPCYIVNGTHNSHLPKMRQIFRMLPRGDDMLQMSPPQYVWHLAKSCNFKVDINTWDLKFNHTKSTKSNREDFMGVGD